MQALEFSTTVDPGYIIQLIRQLLPPAYMNNLGKHSSANVLQNDLRKDKHSAQEEQGTDPSRFLLECLSEQTLLSDARSGVGFAELAAALGKEG